MRHHAWLVRAIQVLATLTLTALAVSAQLAPTQPKTAATKAQAVDPTQWGVRADESLQSLENAQRRAEAQARQVAKANDELAAAVQRVRQTSLSTESKRALLRTALDLTKVVKNALGEGLRDESKVEQAFARDKQRLVERAERIEHEVDVTQRHLEQADAEIANLMAQRDALLAADSEDEQAIGKAYRAYREAQRKQRYFQKRRRNQDKEKQILSRAKTSLQRAHERVTDRFLAMHDMASDLAAVAHTFEVIGEHQQTQLLCSALDRLAETAVVQAGVVGSLDEATRILLDAEAEPTLQPEDELARDTHETGLQRWKREGRQQLSRKTLADKLAEKR